MGFFFVCLFWKGGLSRNNFKYEEWMKGSC